MAKKRVDKRGKREQLTKVKFLVEGATEKSYFRELLKDMGYSLYIDIDNVDGGGYSSFSKEIDKIKFYMI